MTRIINLTPHDIDVVLDGINLKIPKSGKVLRRETQEIWEKNIEIFGIEIPITKRSFGKFNIKVPRRRETYYIVSSLIARNSKRTDFLIPNAIRNKNGKITGCSGFSIISEEK